MDDHGVGAWRLASLRDWRRESRRFSAARFSAELMARGRALDSAKASSASLTSSSCCMTSRSRMEQRRAATTSAFVSSWLGYLGALPVDA